MAANLTPAQREEHGFRAWSLSLRGMSAPTIARELSVSERTVDSLLKREREKAAKGRETERSALLARFEGEQDAVIADAWKRLDAIGYAERTAPDLEANILAASVNKAKAQGLFIDRVEHSGSIDLLHKLLATPQTVIVPDPPDNREFES